MKATIETTEDGRVSARRVDVLAWSVEEALLTSYRDEILALGERGPERLVVKVEHGMLIGWFHGSSNVKQPFLFKLVGEILGAIDAMTDTLVQTIDRRGVRRDVTGRVA